MPKLAIIGCGPMGLYALKEALASNVPFDIDIYEASDTPGSGMPYSRRMNTPEMLCNAFSREIPSMTEPFITWVRRQEAGFLEAHGLTEEQFGARSFYPRTLVGEYFQAQLTAFESMTDRMGRTINVHAKHHVTDIAPTGGGYRISGLIGKRHFSSDADHILIATGHEWPEQPELAGVELMSPWPMTALEGLPSARIGIVGSSLSAIDVALATAGAHGTFEEAAAGARWLANDASSTLRITMLSREGVMPEPDFYYPYPYEQLVHLTSEAVAAEIAHGAHGLLDRLLALLCDDIEYADHEYFAAAARGAKSLETFTEAYFRNRAMPDGLTAMRGSLKKARESFELKTPIPHRHVLLRASEALDPAIRQLSNADYQRFAEYLRPVLADAYAAVPHRSAARILALHEAGVLDLRGTDDAADFRTGQDGSVSVFLDGETLVFDVVIDARGQAASTVDRLPFPSLVKSLKHTRAVEAPFRLSIRGDNPTASAYCLAMPQLLERHPFAQGLAECAAISRIAVRDFTDHLRSTGADVPEGRGAISPAVRN